MRNSNEPKTPYTTIGNVRIRYVTYLVDFARERGTSLNELAMMGFSKEDWTQLAQLIGYSLGGFGELSYVDDYTYETAEMMHEDGLNEKDARIAYLEGELRKLKQDLREPIAKLFGVHPDDLKL